MASLLRSLVTRKPRTLRRLDGLVVVPCEGADRDICALWDPIEEQIVDLMPDEYKAGNPSLYKQGLLKNMIGYSEDGQMSMKAAQNVYKVLEQFEPSVKAAGKMDLSQTFDNSFARKAAAKYK